MTFEKTGGLLSKTDSEQTVFERIANLVVRTESEKTVASTSSRSTCISPPFAGKKFKTKTKTQKAVWVGRLFFVLCLAAVAAILGFLSFKLLRVSDLELAKAQFVSTAERGLACMETSTQRKHQGLNTMAEVIGSSKPDASQWPFVAINNFDKIASDIINVSKGCNMAFCPIVKTGAELTAFEEHAYKHYYESRVPQSFPRDVAMSSFGRGVWTKDANSEAEDKRVHNLNAAVSWGDSPNKIVTPLFQHSTGPSKKLMMDVHGVSPILGPAIDDMLSCAEQRKADGKAEVDCGAILTILPNVTSWVQQVESGPGATMIAPVYPANDPFTVTGLVVTQIVWAEILVGVFAPGVSGVDVTLQANNKEFTYHVTNGKATLLGTGDLHDRKYDSYAATLLMTPPEEYSTTSSSITMTVYPTDDFFGIYCSASPARACILVVAIILCVTLCFFVFDKFVRKEFHAQTSLLEAKRKFVAFVSHEVRTPLNTVCMGLSLMQEELQAQTDASSSCSEANHEKAAEWLALSQDILGNTRSAVNVLNDLLNYDKVETGTLSLEFTAVSIWDLVERTAGEFKLPTQKKEIKFEIEAPSIESTALKGEELSLSDFKVIGDRIRLAQVLRNLLSNACKFTPQHGSLSVRAEWQKPNDASAPHYQEFDLTNGGKVELSPIGWLCVTVADSGAGMTQDQLRNVFRQGTQFNVNRLQAGEGSGLGLFIAKALVEHHGGQLQVQSAGLGKGTSFLLHLPVYRSPPSPSLAPESPEGPQTKTGIISDPKDESLHILVVDDAALNRKLLKRLLIRHGHTVEEAEDGQMGLEKFAEAQASNKPFDTILMDNCMPNMDGPTAATELRRMGCDSFIVGVTGCIMAEEVAHYRQSGANAVLPKPLDLAELEALWNEHGVLGSIPTAGDAESNSSMTEAAFKTVEDLDV